MTPHLQTSLTLISEADDSFIDYHVFENADRHILIESRQIGDSFKELAMKEASILKIPVGSKEVNEKVEFYVFDLKRDKGIQAKIGKIIHLAWIDAVYGVFRLSANPECNFLGDEATGPLDKISDLIELRRFIANALTPTARKKKLNKLLFHHMIDNAPRDR